MPPTVPPSATLASTVPASSRALREVHPGGISVPTEVPTSRWGGCRTISIFEPVRRVDRNRPMEDDDPHHARVVEAPRPRLGLMSQVSDIMAGRDACGGRFHRVRSCQGMDEG